MVAGLRAMGADMDAPATTGRCTPAPARAGQVDVGNAGTVMRFLPPVRPADGPVRFDGDPRARERPLAPVVGALRDLGVEVGTAPACRSWCTGAAGCSAAVSRSDASTSSQFVSALLLAAPRFADGGRGAPRRRTHAVRRPQST